MVNIEIIDNTTFKVNNKQVNTLLRQWGGKSNGNLTTDEYRALRDVIRGMEAKHD